MAAVPLTPPASAATPVPRASPVHLCENAKLGVPDPVPDVGMSGTAMTTSQPKFTERVGGAYSFRIVFSELDEISNDITDLRDQLSQIRATLKKRADIDDLPDELADLRSQIKELRQRVDRQEDSSFGAHKLFHEEIDKIKDGRHSIREEIKHQRQAREKMKRRVDERPQRPYDRRSAYDERVLKVYGLTYMKDESSAPRIPSGCNAILACRIVKVHE
ncbi:hypothetical protein AURDEDRAFT_125288 [Auricularia subglabra TFB-10046 SS5]|nr:hypothetical protein AURDEDRAFT_125288 [Auricularia subglabra TFB-10046 SS5]